VLTDHVRDVDVRSHFDEPHGSQIEAAGRAEFRPCPVVGRRLGAAG